MAGSVSPKLFVSTSGTDSDWVVKLIDVYPSNYGKRKGEEPTFANDAPIPPLEMGGYQQLVRGEPLRGKFRHGWDHPEPFVPGRIEPVDYTMADINHTFRKGHRIMVQVQSSWFPLVDLNPQTFVNIPDAKLVDFQKATERVYHSKDSASGIVLQTLDRVSAKYESRFQSK